MVTLRWGRLIELDLSVSLQPPSRPRVSVIMANFNGGTYLRDAVESVLSQSLRNIELIVSDDGSSDDSLASLDEIQDDRLTVLTSETNSGPGAARNRALDVARGSWIAIVDADDLLHQGRFERLLALAEDLDVSVIADDQLFFSENDTSVGQRLFEGADIQAPIAVGEEQLLAKHFGGVPNILGYLKPMIRRDALGSLRYRTDVKVGEDFDLLLRLALAGYPATVVPEAYYSYRRREGSVSHRLAPENAAAMIVALKDIRDTAPRLRTLIDARIAGIVKRQKLEDTICDLKSRRLMAASHRMVQTPAIIGGLAHLAARRLKPVARRPVKSIKSEIPRPIGNGASDTPSTEAPLVHVRTPTYKRPETLLRALKGIQAQTVTRWICDVFDDDPDGSGCEVVRELADHRIRYNKADPPLLASSNIDRCFSKTNPYEATYFCVLEDDNQLLPTFFEENIQICKTKGVEIVLRNQLVEIASGTPQARVSDGGLLDRKFAERIYEPNSFHLSLMADMGVSNGGLFWTRNMASDLEIGVQCSSTLQEYLRTFAIDEPVYVAMEPLGIWAENGSDTTRNLGVEIGWLRRELSLKRSIQILQRESWKKAKPMQRNAFLTDDQFKYPASERATGLIKSLTKFHVGNSLPKREVLRLTLRGALIRLLGRPEPGLNAFLKGERSGKLA